MYELRISPCSAEQAETLSEQLETLDAVSVSMMDFEDVPILEPGVGETPLWNRLILTALFMSEEKATQAQIFVQNNYPEITQTITSLPEQDWERVCLERFQPLQFGQRLWICPSWLTPPDPCAINLILDPGLAFGTGTHATTSLCLTWLDAYTSIQDQVLIDYGCGSGILALAALKLGAQHAYAVDIDSQALVATTQNREINHVPAHNITIGHPEILSKPVDIIIANILLAPLLNLKMTFFTLLKTQGKLIISGIFTSQVEKLMETYSDSFDLLEIKTLEEWALLSLVRR